MKVSIFQHAGFEQPGYILDWLKQAGVKVAVNKVFEEGINYEELKQADALVIMGGPMGVQDEPIYPWLKEEKAFLKKWIEQEKRVLGVCLGAQLLAVCLGGKVHPAANKEIGWFMISPEEGSGNPPEWMNLVKQHPVVFHWHGDQFEFPVPQVRLPEKSLEIKELFYSEANHHQCFIVEKNVIGLQCHLEMTEESLALMLDNGRSELALGGSFIQSEAEILNGKHFLENNHQILGSLLDFWLEG